MISIENIESPGYKLIQALEGIHLPSLGAAQIEKFDAYVKLILRWNSRMNLTAIREVDAIIDRHIVECIACANALPEGIKTLLDFGSGAGFPGIPIAICRPEIAVSLAESQVKKSAFLQEAVRTLGLGVKIHTGRAEKLQMDFDCVAMRAVDRMQVAIVGASRLVRPGGQMAVLTTNTELARACAAAGSVFAWQEPIRLPGSDRRVLALGKRNAGAALDVCD